MEGFRLAGVGFLVWWLLASVLAEDQFVICVRDNHPGEYATIIYFCNKLAERLAHSGIHLKCIEGDSRMDCLKKVANDGADVTFTIYPEDVVVAGTFFSDNIVVLAEVHEPGAFQERMVAVVRTESEISKLDDLQGKKACFPNFSLRKGEATDNPAQLVYSTTRTILGLLQEAKVVPMPCQDEMSRLEREFHSLFNTFGSACVPGVWGFDNTSETYLRAKYGDRLCDACPNKTRCVSKQLTPSAVEAQDPFKCLKAGGDVAWVKASKIRHRFKDHSDLQKYRVLCMDGALEDLDLSDTPRMCDWGSKPWPVFLAKKALGEQKLNSLKNQLKTTLGSSDQEALDFTNKTFQNQIKPREKLHSVQEKGRDITMMEPLAYAQHNGYTFKFEYPDCGKTDNISMCVIDELEKEKCEEFSMAVNGQCQTSLQLICVVGNSPVSCLNMIKSGQVDMAIVDSGLSSLAEQTGEYKIIMTGNEPHVTYYIQALVKESSGIRFIEDLKRKRSCHISHGENDFGWNMPLRILEAQGYIGKTCGLENLLKSFFNESCVYGHHLSNDSAFGHPDNLCRACKDGEDNSLCPASNFTDSTPDQLALECLESGLGDVAFIHNYTGTESPSFAGSEYIWVCPWNSSVDPHSQTDCNWGAVTSRRFVVMSAKKKKQDVDNAMFLIGNVMKMGMVSDALVKPSVPYHGSHNVLISDETTGFIRVDKYVPANQLELVNQNNIREVVECSSNIHFPPATTSSANENLPGHIVVTCTSLMLGFLILR